MRNRFYQWEAAPLHVMGKCEADHWPATTMSEAWSLFSFLVTLQQSQSPLVTHAFVLMRNHYHWLCSPTEPNGQQALDSWHYLVSSHFSERQGLLCKVLSSPPRVDEQLSLHQYCETYRYVYRNPINAGIVSFAEDYPFSSLFYIFRAKDMPFTCIDNMNLITDPFRTLHWINSRPSLV